MTRRQQRPSRAIWQALRQQVWERDGGRCQGPYCRDAPSITLEAAHIDHIMPLSQGGTNDLANLRTLCRRCHVLRADQTHQGMIAAALRDDIIPPDWRALVWDDIPPHDYIATLRRFAMPLLQKPPSPLTERVSASNTSDRAALLAQLLGATPERGFAGESRPVPRPRRRSTTRYDRLVQVGATVIGLLGCALVWLIGSYFTLRWLASLGVGLAATGLAPIHTLLQIGPADDWIVRSSLRALWPTIAAAWALPLAITLIETGFDPARAGGRSSRLIWGIFLRLDAVTSALGIQPILVRFVADLLTSWAVAAIVGLLLALVPEKLARRLIIENL
jgi:5-methylcytosine-specific restriction enzyme A